MQLHSLWVLCFRSALMIVFFVICYLALSPVNNPVIGSLNDKVTHLVAFVCVMFLADFSFPHTGLTWKKCVAVLSFGIGIECAQSFFPYRDFSVYDIVADLAGIAIYSALLPLIRRLPILKDRWK